MSAQEFDGKSVIVTGAGAGMGKTITKGFIKMGAIVIAVDIQERALQKLKKELNDTEKLVLFPSDISKEETSTAMVQKALDITGKLDILVNNAGVGGHSEAIADTSTEDWNRILDVNLNGPMYATRASVRQMLKQKSGNIIFISSVAGIRGCRSCVAYGVAKHGIIGLAEHTAYSYMHEGIRSNVICPGAIHTSMSSTTTSENAFGRLRILSGMDSNFRFGETEDIANTVFFLASEKSRFITGATIVVDGGMSCN